MGGGDENAMLENAMLKLHVHHSIITNPTLLPAASRREEELRREEEARIKAEKEREKEERRKRQAHIAAVGKPPLMTPGPADPP